jgi:AcrR family transcriptional regulator
MADAGLTRGSFYSYFESKGDLYAEAVTHVLNEKQLLSSDGVSIDPRAVDNAAQFIRDYLSLEHFEDIDGSCPLIAFPSEFLRRERRVQQAFETVLKAMIDVFEQAFRNGAAARNRAHAIAALCVGGMVLARSIEDRALADELREAAMGVALSLGQWPRRTPAEMPQDSAAAL